MKRRYPLLILATLALGLVAGMIYQSPSAPAPTPPELSVPLLPEPRDIAPFRLTDHNGNALDADRLRGKWSLLFIGYTNCPDVCPTTLQTLVGAARKMSESPDGLEHTQFIFVSVDPKRDSPEQLRGYLDYFNKAFADAIGEPAHAIGASHGSKPSKDQAERTPVPPLFIGATGERAQIDKLVSQLGGVYMFEGDTKGDSYIVNHSATLYLVNPEGRYYARLQPPHDAAQIADLLARIRHFYQR